MTDTSASLNEAEYLRDKTRFNQRLEEAFQNSDFLSFEPPSEWALGYAEMKDLLNRNRSPEKQWIKLQVTGPGTVWRSFFSKEVRENLTTPVRIHLRRILLASGLAQIQRIHLHGRSPVLVIDDPFFLEDVQGLKEMIPVSKKAGAKVGLHVCSPLADCGILKELELDLFHFDLRLWRGTASNNLFLDQFLKEGGRIALGMVPTSPGDRFPVSDFPFFLEDRLGGLQKRGWSLTEVLKQSLLAPACGTGMLTPAEDREVTQGLLQAAEELKNSFFHG